MSFRPALAFFKTTHTQTQTGLSAESKKFYYLPFSLSEVSEETQTIVLNIVVNVRKLEKSLQPCLPDHPVLLPQNSHLQKNSLQAILDKCQREEEGTYFYTKSTFLYSVLPKVQLQKNITAILQVHSHLAKQME